MKKRYHGPWFGNDTERARFEFNARARRLPFRRRLTRGGVEYAVPIVLGHFDDRAATIRFGADAPTFVTVEVDGPTESKHRYPDGHLCMWHPDDPETNRWLFRDGLGALIDHVALHLYREAHWRETGEWLGPEAPHSPKVAA